MQYFLSRSITNLLYIAPLSLFLYGSRFLFPLATLKIHVFYIVIDVIVCLWALAAIKGIPCTPSFKNPLTRATAFFLGVLTLAAIFGFDPIQSFFSTPARTIGVVGLWHFFAFYLAIATFINTPQRRAGYIRFLFILASIVALSGVLQIFFPHLLFGGATDRHGGFLDNPIFLAGYLLGYLFLAVFYLRAGSALSRSLTIICSLALLGGFWSANTRGAVIGLVAGALVSLVLAFLGRNKGEVVRRTITQKISLGVVVVALLALFGPGLASRLSGLSFTQASVANRVTSWRNAWSSFTMHPLLGVGPENFRFVSDQYFNPLVIQGSQTERYFDKPHSVPLEVLSTSGALGFIAYLYLLYQIVRSIARAGLSVRERALAYGALAGFWVQGLFSFESFGTYLTFFAGMGLLSSVSQEDKKTSSPFWWRLSLGIVAILALCAIAWNIASINKGRVIFLLPQTTSAEIFAAQAQEKLSTRPHHAGNTIALNQYYGMLKDALLQGVPGSAQILAVLESWTTDKEPANLTSLGLSYFILFAQSDYENMAYAEKAEGALEKARALRPLDERTLRGLYCLYYTTSDSRASGLREQLKTLFPDLTDENICLL